MSTTHQQTRSVGPGPTYCDEHGVTDGWFAYFGQGVLEPRAHGIPLRPLQTATSLALGEEMQVPPVIGAVVGVQVANPRR